MAEIWKDIPEYEGLYQVSNIGRVKSFISNHGRKKGFIPHCERILKPASARGGYLRVRLTHYDNTLHYFFIHRLVLMAFCGKIKNKRQVNHINGIKTDNRLENLEWVTQSENMKHTYRIGLEKPCDNGLKKTVYMIKNGKCIQYFNSIRGMCREMNFDRRTVMRVIKGERKSYKGLKFKIKI